MSVTELAYLFKMLDRTKLIKIVNPKRFFKIITQTFRTKNSDNISTESLRSKFYKPEHSQKLSLKGKLLELVNAIISDI